MLGRFVAVCGVLVSGAAFANDSISELGTGGLILSRTDAVRMQSEKLSISMDEVTVDYVFKNDTDKDVNATVAFPMPDITGTVYDRPQIPDGESDNFLGFEVKVDGKDVKPQLQQRAVAVGVDITDLLEKNHVPVNPFAQPVFAALEALPEATANEWIDRGLIFIDSYDDGSGWKNVRTPMWSLQSAYWWQSSFPAGKEVKVWHRYKPSVGGTSGLTFFFDNKFQDGEGTYSDYKKRYCMDDTFEKAILKAAKESKDGYPLLMEQRLQYVLTTGGNWALGTIGDFQLTIDKGKKENLISFCGQGVKKTGPTTFEMTAKDFYPEHDLDILILTPYELEGEEPTAAKGRGIAPRRGERPAPPGGDDQPAGTGGAGQAPKG
jgi:Domain of unknown function (DUF4424)